MSSELKEITLLEGIAAILIVVYHSMETFNSSDALFLKNTLRINEMGLFLFTFLSGYKLALNHIGELENKQFLKKYSIKRFNRLYKPYIGYSLMIFIPEYFLIYVSTCYFKLDFLENVTLGINNIVNSLNIGGLINLLLGNNFISPHLWYIFALLIITSICFSILYWANIKYLYGISCMIYLYYFIDPIKDIPYIDDRIIYYFPAFVFGIYQATYQKNIYVKKIAKILPILFIILVVQIASNDYYNNYYLTAYGYIFPCLIISVSSLLTRVKPINNILYFCGKYSFQIYLFQLPFIIHLFQLPLIHPSFERYFVNAASISYNFVPYILSILTILTSVFIYKICRKIKLNILFE